MLIHGACRYFSKFIIQFLIMNLIMLSMIYDDDLLSSMLRSWRVRWFFCTLMLILIEWWIWLQFSTKSCECEKVCGYVWRWRPSPLGLVICLQFDYFGALFDFSAPFNRFKSANILRHSCEQRIAAIGGKNLKKERRKRNEGDGLWCTFGNRILRQLPAFHPRLSRRCFSVSNEALMHAWLIPRTNLSLRLISHKIYRPICLLVKFYFPVYLTMNINHS